MSVRFGHNRGNSHQTLHALDTLAVDVVCSQGCPPCENIVSQGVELGERHSLDETSVHALLGKVAVEVQAERISEHERTAQLVLLDTLADLCAGGVEERVSPALEQV